MLLALVLASLLDEPVADTSTGAPAPVEVGVISGFVRDTKAHAPAVEAPVTLRRPDGFERAATTNASGLYVFRELAPGTYVVTASYGAAKTIKTIDLAPDAKLRVNFQLDPTRAIVRVALVKPLKRANIAADWHRSRGCRRWYRKLDRVYVRAARQQERAARREARKR